MASRYLQHESLQPIFLSGGVNLFKYKQITTIRTPRSHNAASLFVVLLVVIVGADAEVAQLVRGLVVGHDTDPVTQRVLLEVTLRQVLQVALGEVHIGVDVHLVLLALERDVVVQVVDLALVLHALLQVLLL